MRVSFYFFCLRKFLKKDIAVKRRDMSPGFDVSTTKVLEGRGL